MRKIKINGPTQDLLLNIGLEVGDTKEPVDIVTLCEKYGTKKNDSTLYARIDILEREGYIQRYKETGKKMKVSPTLDGWRFLGQPHTPVEDKSQVKDVSLALEPEVVRTKITQGIGKNKITIEVESSTVKELEEIVETIQTTLRKIMLSKLKNE